MKVKYVCACGHIAGMKIGTEELWKVEKAERRPCDNCRLQRIQEEENEGWGVLSGTTKQILWAEDIRKQKIRELTLLETNPLIIKYAKENFHSAQYWIANRKQPAIFFKKEAESCYILWRQSHNNFFMSNRRTIN